MQKVHAQAKENQRYLTYLGLAWGGLHVDMSIIPTASTVISAGLADDISFDKELIKQKRCYIIGIDPTRRAAKTIRKFKFSNPSKAKHFTLIRRALSDRANLTVRLGGQANTFLSPQGEKAKTIAINDLLSMYPGAALLKMDIEGAEFPVIENITKLRIPQVAVGFHVWLNSESDVCPNEGIVPCFYTPQDVIDCVNKIKAMGYKLVYESRERPERIGQETLFIRNDFASKFRDIELTS